MSLKYNLEHKSHDIHVFGYTLIPARGHNGRELDTDTGPKFTKQLYMQSVNHDVCELMCGRDMEDTNLPQSNLLADEVDVNLDVLRATMMNRIDYHVDCTNVVAIDNGHQRNQDISS